jgi:hypothetical protein
MLDRDAKLRPSTALVLALVVLAPTAWGGSSTGSPTGASAALLNISGQYAGTVNDSVFGKGQIVIEVTQYRNAVAGILLFTYPGSVALITPGSFLLSGNSLTGRGASATLSGDPCPLSETATYTTTHHLNGSYKAISGCSGETGTFTTKQQCRYPPDLAMESGSALKRC